MFKKTRKAPVRHTINCEAELGFNYQIRFSQRKTAAIEIKRQTVTVAAPFGTNVAELHHWVIQKRAWIQRKRQQQNLRLQASPQPQFVDGETWLFMGKPLTLQLIYNSRKDAEILDSTLYLPIMGSAAKIGPEQIKKRLARWYLNQAEEYMGPKTLQLARQIGKEVADIRFRRTKTKWGHCTSQGAIQYNWLVMMAPRDIIDYLIAHEVSHLQHPNHSARFWLQVEKLAPNYRQQRQWLKNNGYKLIL